MKCIAVLFSYTLRKFAQVNNEHENITLINYVYIMATSQRKNMENNIKAIHNLITFR